MAFRRVTAPLLVHIALPSGQRDLGGYADVGLSQSWELRLLTVLRRSSLCVSVVVDSGPHLVHQPADAASANATMALN